jgi:predicted kinase
MDILAREIYDGATPEFGAIVDAWGAYFPLLRRLADTPQDPEWHAEGNVHVHTSMVLKKTYERLEALELSPERRLSLILGATFHDVAKPMTTRTRVIDGKERIVAPRHADEGRSYLAYKILKLGLPVSVVKQLMSLVAYHHRPKHLVLKDRPARSYRHLARLADIELLYHLEQADMRGRTCADRAGQIEYIDLFRLLAEEHGVYHSHKAAQSLYADWHNHITYELDAFDQTTRDFVFAQAVREAEAGTIYTPQEAVARSYQYRDKFAELVVLCGPSGSGKTAWARENLPDHHVVSMDDIRQELTGDAADQSRNGEVRQLAKKRLKEHLRNHRRIVWDATNLRRDFRRVPLSLGFDYDAFTKLVVFHMPPDEFRRRNRERDRSVPDAILDKQLKSVQWPELDEAHRVVFVRPESQPVSLR